MSGRETVLALGKTKAEEMEKSSSRDLSFFVFVLFNFFLGRISRIGELTRCGAEG